MKEEVKKLFEKAEHAIRASDLLLQDEEIDSAAGRAYYAMFYVASALLRSRNLRYKKHGGVHAAFGENFAKTEVINPQFHIPSLTH